MSVHENPVLVTRMLIAPTMPVLTAVLVNWDLLEMVQFVKVCECEKLSTASSSRTAYRHYVLFYMKLNAMCISIVSLSKIFLLCC